MSDSAGRPDRLDSWKAIAAYLQRTERTVRRWEQELGLPVRRVSGERGRSVFAYVSEIDQWLKETRPDASNGDGNGNGNGDAVPGHAPPQPAAARRWRPVVAAASLLVIAAVGWAAAQWSLSAAPAQMEFTGSGVVARDAAGAEQWRYRFAADTRAERVYAHPESVELRTSPETGVLAAAGLFVNTDESIEGGELLWLSARGALQRRFAFGDSLAFGAGEYGAPWGITDFREDTKGGSGRIAVAAHHYTWWPGVVTVLDENWQRRGTFVNAGWIERVHWLTPDRLLVAGFSNARDGGMVAMLDANALDGQSPDTGDPQFGCLVCGADRPLRYVVMPRTEINRATQSRFNRARIEALPDRILVRTVEIMVSETNIIDAVYEFTPSLEFIAASFSARYWQMHAQLEAEGKLDHSREQCPERDGPQPIQVWEPSTGWTTTRAR
jgi:hypothetical protein